MGFQKDPGGPATLMSMIEQSPPELICFLTDLGADFNQSCSSYFENKPILWLFIFSP